MIFTVGIIDQSYGDLALNLLYDWWSVSMIQDDVKEKISVDVVVCSMDVEISELQTLVYLSFLLTASEIRL